MRFGSVVVVTSLAVIAAAQDFGPIATRNHRALDLPYLRFDIRGGLVPAGQSEWMFSATSANDSRFEPRPGPPKVFEDQETERFLVRYRKGLRSGFEFGIEVPFLWRGGGFMDPFIVDWHKIVLRWTDAFRAFDPIGKCLIQVPGSIYGAAAGFGDTSLYLSKTVNRHLDLGLGLKLPTGNPGELLGSGGFDAGFSAQYRQTLPRKWTLFAMLGCVAQSPGNALDSARGLVHQEALAFTWQRSAKDSWVLQWQGEASAVVTGNARSDMTQRAVTFGYQRKLPRERMLELSFTEDRDLFAGHWPEGASIAPDFTIHVGLTSRVRS